MIDDENIYEKNRLWPNNIGYIPQFIYLTDDTIRRNIAFGIKDEEIDDWWENVSKEKNFINLKNNLFIEKSDYINSITKELINI